MPRKKKKARFTATKAVKSMAREAIGAPPPTRAVPVKKKQSREKHKPSLQQLLREE